MRTLIVIVLLLAGAPARAAESTALLAGGCFWCMESDFEKVPGVVAVVSGYTGGREENPTYEEVSAHRTGHTEAVEVRFDPARVSYEQLLEHFWRNIDPLTANAQFCDQGPQYRAGIFPLDAAQKAAADASKARFEKELGQRFVTEITPAGPFYRAEDYHQDYYRKNPLRYKFYRHNCGRDAALERIWGKRRP